MYSIYCKILHPHKNQKIQERKKPNLIVVKYLLLFLHAGFLKFLCDEDDEIATGQIFGIISDSPEEIEEYLMNKSSNVMCNNHYVYIYALIRNKMLHSGHAKS